MADTRGMLARLRKLERSHGATDEMRGWISDGTARSGIAGEGLLR